MEVALLRSLTEFLNDGTAGVNAKLASLTRDGTDPAPAAVVTITDETTDPIVARGDVPTARPAIAVNLTGSWELEGEVFTTVRDATDGIQVLIRLILEDTDSAAGATNAWYYQRALRQSLRAWLANDQAVLRTRNQVQILECMKMTVLALHVDDKQSAIVSGLVLHLQVRDLNP